MRSRRTAQYQLACLVKLGYLNTAPVRSTSPNFPAVYFVTGRGVETIASAYEHLGRRWHGSPTESAKGRGLGATSIVHELFLTEFSLALDRALQHRPDIRRAFSQRRYFTARETLFCEQQGRRTRLVPDLGVMLQFSSSPSDLVSHRSLLLFVEMDRGTMPMRRVAEKIDNYAAWGRSENADRYLPQIGTSPAARTSGCDWRLLWVAHAAEGGNDTNRVHQLLDTASMQPRSMRDRIWITSVELLRHHSALASPLLEELWLRPVGRPSLSESVRRAARQCDPHTFLWRGSELHFRNLFPRVSGSD